MTAPTKPKTIFKLADNLTFGKYKGKTIQEVLDIDPDYLEWAIETIDWFELDNNADNALEDALIRFDEGDGYGSFDWEDGHPMDYGDR